VALALVPLMLGTIVWCTARPAALHNKDGGGNIPLSDRRPARAGPALGTEPRRSAMLVSRESAVNYSLLRYAPIACSLVPLWRTRVGADSDVKL